MNEENIAIDTDIKSTKKNSWKKYLFFPLLALLSIILLAFISAWLFEDKIKAKIVSEINEQVTVPIQVDGEISFSVFKHFPYASLTFSQVSIDDILDKHNKKLLKVEEFSFLCNIFSLFGNKIEFSKVVVRNGELNMLIKESGKTNFNIFKPTKGNAKSSLAVQLKKAQIKNVRFTFFDKSQATALDILVNEIKLSGNFDYDNFELDTKGKLRVHYISAKGEEYIANRNVTAEIVLDINKHTKKYNFKKGVIAIDESEFNITGFFATLKNGTQLDFKLINEGKDIQQLFALFPEKYKAAFSSANGSGQYAVAANIKGMLNKTSMPKIDVSADLKDSEIKLGKFNKLLKNVNANATYALDENGNDKLIISNFNCTLNEVPFNFKLSLTHLSDPYFDFYANGVLNLDELSAFIPDSIIQDINGSITFTNFNLKGRKRDFVETENSTLTGSGQFKLNDIEFRQNGITYGNINGILKYENRQIEATNFTLNFLSTDFSFTGTIDNLFAYIYTLSAKRNTTGVVLGVNGKVKAQTLNLSAILDAYNKKNNKQVQQKEKVDIHKIFSIKGNLDVEVDRFIYRKMDFKKIKTNVSLAPSLLQINHLNTLAMEGEIRSTGLISFTPENALNLKLDITAVDLSIPKIFIECDNFGQTTLTDKNLKGKLNTSITLDATWKNYKDIDMSTLSTIIDFRIEDGALLQFAPLRAASKFIKLEELENIRFANLENTIKIANSRIDIPEFEIKTSALNLMFFGHHFFDNTVDYHFKINLHKLLAQKFTRKNQDEVQYIENDPYEGLNIFLTMTGNLSNPTIKFDKASVRKKIQADFKNEKQVLKDLLRNTPKKVDENEQKREDKYFDIKEEPKFIDFEDEPK